MANIVSLEHEIEALGQEFHAWRMSNAWKPVIDAGSEDAATRVAGHYAVTELFSKGGKAKIEEGLTRMIGLQSKLAAEHGSSASKLFFHEVDALGKGIATIEAEASCVLDRYFGFKAKLNHTDLLHPSEIMAPVGNWGEALPWDESRQVAAACFEPLGMSDLAHGIANKTATGPGQEFWKGFEPRLKDIPGLMGPRIAAHEMGHAVHFQLSGTSKIRPEVAEIVSTMQEALFTKEMAKRAKNPQQSVALLSNQLNADVAMVEQAGKLNFERNAYRYAEEHPGQTIPVTKLWREASGKILGQNISQAGEHTATMDSRLMLWDQYMHQPGYGSGYLVGWAAAPKLLEKLEADPATFQETYRAILAKGNSLNRRVVSAETPATPETPRSASTSSFASRSASARASPPSNSIMAARSS